MSRLLVAWAPFLIESLAIQIYAHQMSHVDQNKTATQIANLVHEIKRREHAIKIFRAEQYRAIYKAVYVEFCYLQFRKILELISFCSVLANTHALKAIGTTPRKDFNPEKIFRWLDAHYKESFPKPVWEEMDPQPGVRANLNDVTEPYLDRKGFEILYNKCGDILHSKNPLRKPHDLEKFESEISDWHHNLRTLLNKFTLRTLNDDDMYLVSMNTDEVEARPMVHAFKRVDKITPSPGSPRPPPGCRPPWR